jgi:hypothetical protein
MQVSNLITIDPGSKGAAVIRRAEGPVRFVLPYRGRRTVVETVQRALELPRDRGVAALIERVWATSLMGPSNAFAFGGNYEGWVVGFLVAGIPVFCNTPQEWQHSIVPQITSTKEQRKHDLQDAAIAMFDVPVGECLLPPKTRITLDNCDALLLSEVAYRRNRDGIPLGLELK